VPVGPVVPRGTDELPEPVEQPAITARAAAHSATAAARRRPLPLLRGEFGESRVMMGRLAGLRAPRGTRALVPARAGTVSATGLCWVTGPSPLPEGNAA
jgi:hypothetical protein